MTDEPSVQPTNWISPAPWYDKIHLDVQHTMQATTVDRRFELVKIAFSKLKFTYPDPDPDRNPSDVRIAIGRAVVELADAVLAAMETENKND